MLIERWFAARSYNEIEQRFNASRVCWGPYRSVCELLRDDNRVGANNPLYQRVSTEGVGEHWAAGTPVRAEGVARSEVRPAALLGQHTDEVLSSVLGLDSAAVGKLHDAGIVAGPKSDPTVLHR